MRSCFTTPRTRAKVADGQYVFGGFHTDRECHGLRHPGSGPPVPVKVKEDPPEKHGMVFVRIAGHLAGHLCRCCQQREENAKIAAEVTAALQQRGPA